MEKKYTRFVPKDMFDKFMELWEAKERELDIKLMVGETDMEHFHKTMLEECKKISEKLGTNGLKNMFHQDKEGPE